MRLYVQNLHLNINIYIFTVARVSFHWGFVLDGVLPPSVTLCSSVCELRQHRPRHAWPWAALCRWHHGFYLRLHCSFFIFSFSIFIPYPKSPLRITLIFCYHSYLLFIFASFTVVIFSPKRGLSQPLVYGVILCETCVVIRVCVVPVPAWWWPSLQGGGGSDHQTSRCCTSSSEPPLPPPLPCNTAHTHTVRAAGLYSTEDLTYAASFTILLAMYTPIHLIAPRAAKSGNYSN